MRISRTDLLAQLQTLDPGLSPKETSDQSSSFVFKDGEVMSFNGEIACRRPSMLNGVEGAVKAIQLKQMLDKLTEDEVTVEKIDKELVIKAGKNKEAAFVLDTDITMPVDQIEPPEEWRKLPKGFAEAVSMVYQCASTEEQFFFLTCVHITPKWLEASDNVHAIRYMIDTGFPDEALVRHTSIKHIVDMEATRVSETEHYVHFKSKSGLLLSVRRFSDEFPNLDNFISVEGAPIGLAKSLIEGADRAEIASAEDKEANRIRVRLKDGFIALQGQGLSARYKEWKKIKYRGEPVDFYIAPKLLIHIIEKHENAVINSRRLAVQGENYTYVSSLIPVKKEIKDGKKKAKASS